MPFINIIVYNADTMPRKKQIHAAQTDLLPAEKKEIPAGDVRLFLKNLTLHNMQSLKSKISTATILEHKIIQEAINAAAKGAGVDDNKVDVNINMPPKTLEDFYTENSVEEKN